MKAWRPGSHPIAAFAVPYIVGVAIAVATLWCMSAVAMLLEADGKIPMDRFALTVFWLVGAGIASAALIPAIVAVWFIERGDREPSSVQFAIWGAVVGGVAVLIGLMLSVDLDFANRWVRESILQRLYLVPAFAIAGGISGAVFGALRLRLLRNP